MPPVRYIAPKVLLVWKITPMPKVSVLITLYNAAPFVRQALESVFAQDFQDLELCVVDDGSSDDSLAILREIAAAAPVPLHWKTQPNAGQAAALNTAFEMASGEIIALLDGDDYWYPSKLSEMLDFMVLNPGGGVYQHQVDDGAGIPLRPFVVSGDIFGKWTSLGTVNPVVHQDWMVINMPTTGLLFTRSTFESIGPLPAAMVVNPDFYLFVLGCSLGPVYTSPRSLGCWRQHPGNASRRGAYSFKSYWVRVLFPLVNEKLAQRGHLVRFKFNRAAILWQPLVLLKAVWRRRNA